MKYMAYTLIFQCLYKETLACNMFPFICKYY